MRVITGVMGPFTGGSSSKSVSPGPSTRLVKVPLPSLAGAGKEHYDLYPLQGRFPDLLQWLGGFLCGPGYFTRRLALHSATQCPSLLPLKQAVEHCCGPWVLSGFGLSRFSGVGGAFVTGVTVSACSVLVVMTGSRPMTHTLLAIL